MKYNHNKGLVKNAKELRKNMTKEERHLWYDYLKNKEVYADIDNEVKKIKVDGINRDYSLRIEDGNEFRDLFTGEISFHL